MTDGGVLPIDDADLNTCVACGLCLPHCPTYRVTGLESASPRGRIAAMRAVQWAGAPVDDDFVDFMERCVQCRGCEPACPSGVPFGRLMEGAREAIAATRMPRRKRAAFRLLGRHRTLLALSTAAAIAQRVTPSAPWRRVGLPRLPLRRGRLHATGTDVWLFTGCVMDAWQRPVHAAAIRVLEAAGVGVMLPGRGAACCGALAAHAGLRDLGHDQRGRVIDAMPGDAPVLVDSAGCGAALLAAPAPFRARVFDIHTWLAARIDRLPEAPAGQRFPALVAVQDPCHLRHVQRAHEQVRTVLARYADIVTLDDDGLCCGAGGAYASQQPQLATAIRSRKLEAITASGATVVASANPGCTVHLQAAGLDVRHPIEIVDEVLHGRSG
jgi:glycolate oxidase iron-sulfur subunit